MDNRVLTIIPAKAGSTRLPGKNILELGGRPLLGRTIEAAQKSGICGRVMVSTESQEVADVARDFGAEVPFMRPPHLARDPYGVEDVCFNVLDGYEALGRDFQLLIILLPSSPFMLSRDIVEAMDTFRAADAKFLFSVVEMGHVFNALEFMGPGAEVRPRFPEMAACKRHEVPRLFRPNGAITILDVKAFREQGTYYGTPLHAHVMPRERSVDIDTGADLEYARYLLEKGVVDVES